MVFTASRYEFPLPNNLPGTALTVWCYAQSFRRRRLSRHYRNVPKEDTAPASHALRTQVLRINNETQLSIKRSNFIHGKYLQCLREQVFINMPASTKVFEIWGKIWVDIGQKRMRFHIVLFFLLNSLKNVALWRCKDKTFIEMVNYIFPFSYHPLKWPIHI